MSSVDFILQHPVQQILAEPREDIISSSVVEHFIAQYFRVEINPSHFSWNLNKLRFLEIEREDKKEGYVFAGPFSDFRTLPINILGKLSSIAEKYNSPPNRVIHLFFNYDDHVAGFSWRADK